MKAAKLITILTGAGISAESGIRTFRDNNGLWHDHRIEDVATPEAFERNPKLVQDFYNERRKQLLEPDVAPNTAHTALAKLQREYSGRVVLVTQNVDNLHERAGSPHVIHMHGELLKARCSVTEQVVGWSEPILLDTTRCACCGALGTLRPHIVWFGEMPLEMSSISAVLSTTDIFVAIGTSGNVYPAAAFAHEARENGAYVLELNKESGSNGSAFDEARYGNATTVVTEWVEEVLNGSFFDKVESSRSKLVSACSHHSDGYPPVSALSAIGNNWLNSQTIGTAHHLLIVGCMSHSVLCISAFLDSPPLAFAASAPLARVCAELSAPERRGSTYGHDVVVRMRRNTSTALLTRWCLEVGSHQLPLQLLDVTSWWWQHSHPLRAVLELELRAPSLALPLLLPYALCQNLVVLDLSGSDLVSVSSYEFDGQSHAHSQDQLLRSSAGDEVRDDAVVFRALRVLRLRGCRRVRRLSVFRACPALTTLDVGETTLTGLNWLTALPSLEEATLGPTGQLVDVRALRTATRLQRLFLSASAVSSLEFITDAHQSLREIDISNCAEIVSAAQVTGCRRLASLTASGSGLYSLNGLRLCVNLQRVTVDHCASLTSLAGLAGAPQLTFLSAASTPVENLNGLARCPNLEEIDVTFCSSLADVSGLAGAPRLRKLVAWSSSIGHVIGLERCPQLEHVNVEFCSALTSLAPLGHCQSLRRVLAGRTALTTLADLSASLTLDELHVVSCSLLRSPAALAGTPALTVLNAEFAGFTTLDGLAECPALRKVNVSFCAALRCLEGLRDCTQLRALCLCATPITTLSGLETCGALQELSISRCVHLTDFAALSHLKILRKLTAQGLSTKVNDTIWLALCTRVEELDISECTDVTDLSVLASFAQLRVLRIGGTGLDNVNFAEKCRDLLELCVDGCAALSTLSPLHSHPAITTIHASHSGLTNLDGLSTCARLDRLSVRACPHLRIECVTQLRRQRPSVKVQYSHVDASEPA